MPKYSFTALDGRGIETQGEIEADSQTVALSRIREQHLFPTNLTEAVVAKPKKGAPAVRAAPKARSAGLKKEIKLPSFAIKTKVKTKQLMVFTRQLATLVDAGLPLVRSLEVLHRQERHITLKIAIAEMADSINTGSTFAEALAHHPKIFNKLYVNMAKAGEVGGVLDQVLVRLADFMEKAQKIKNKVVSAMIYPIVVMCMAVLILMFLMIFIVPKFEAIFKDLMQGKGLPPLTQFVIGVSRTVAGTTQIGPVKIPGIIVVVTVVVALVIAIKMLAKTQKGRYYLDRFKLSAPVFGSLISKTVISRFSRTLGTLMSSGVPVLQALNIVRDTSGNEVIAQAVSQVHDAVKEGENMAPPIEATKVFPGMVVSMIQVGEETGDLPQMLGKIADSYEDEVDNAVAGITSVIEPLLIVFLALIVGTIVIALFLPLISIIGNLSGGQH